jgi:hypothetical protein
MVDYYKDIVFASTSEYPKKRTKPVRVDFRLKEINEFVENQGIKLRITPSMVCPNRTDLTDTNHRLDCQICNGNEVLDLSDKCWETFGVIQSIKHDEKFEVQGIWDVKDSLLTLKSVDRISYWYKIEVVDFSSVYNQIVKRIGDRDKLRYPPAASCDTPYYLIDSTGK